MPLAAFVARLSSSLRVVLGLGVHQGDLCPYLQRGFPAIWPPACPGVWDYSSLGAGFGISFCEFNEIL